MPFGSLRLSWHFSSFYFTFSFAPNLFLCHWTPSQLHGAVGFCEALGKFRLKGANLPYGHKRWICLITNSVAGLKSMLQLTFKKYWHWDFSHCQTGPQTYKSCDFRLIDSVLGLFDGTGHAEIFSFSFKSFLYCLEQRKWERGYNGQWKEILSIIQPYILYGEGNNLSASDPKRFISISRAPPSLSFYLLI